MEISGFENWLEVCYSRCAKNSVVRVHEAIVASSANQTAERSGAGFLETNRMEIMGRAGANGSGSEAVCRAEKFELLRSGHLGYLGYQRRVASSRQQEESKTDPFRNPRDLRSPGSVKSAEQRSTAADQILILTSSGADDVRRTGVYPSPLSVRTSALLCYSSFVRSFPPLLPLPVFFLLELGLLTLFFFYSARSLFPPSAASLALSLSLCRTFAVAKAGVRGAVEAEEADQAEGRRPSSNARVSPVSIRGGLR